MSEVLLYIYIYIYIYMSEDNDCKLFVYRLYEGFRINLCECSMHA